MSKSAKQLQQERQKSTGVGGVDTKKTAPPKPKTTGSVEAIRENELRADLDNGVGFAETSGLDYDSAAKKVGLSRDYQ